MKLITKGAMEYIPLKVSKNIAVTEESGMNCV